MTNLLSRIFAVLAVSACVSLAETGSDGFDASTRPSKDVTMSFTRPGQIAEMHVSVGDKVEAGELLASLDDTVERAQLAQLKAQADDEVRIEAAQAKLDQSKVDLARIEAAWEIDPNRRAVTEFELDQARLEVVIARLSLELSQFEHAQDQRRYEEARLSLERMKLLSPVDGTVEVLFVETGESVDALEQVVHIVNIDPLWIDVAIPVAAARKLAVGDAAGVSFGPDDSQDGTIVYVASVGDAASSTLRVRVELANSAGRPAGERVVVTFAPNATSADGDGPADPTDRQAGQDQVDDKAATDTNDSTPTAQ